MNFFVIMIDTFFTEVYDRDKRDLDKFIYVY